MNFAFKSTFSNCITTAPSERAIRFHILNVISLGVVTVLYFTNQLLPAAVDARPYGTLFLLLFIGAVAFKILGMSWMTVRLMIQLWTKVVTDTRIAELRSTIQRYAYRSRGVFVRLTPQKITQPIESPKQ